MNDDKNFFSSGKYGCTYYPRVNCSGIQSSRTTKYISKISLNDFYSKNEYNIGKKLKKIDKTSIIPIEKRCYVKSKKLKDVKRNYSCRVFKEQNEKYVILYSKYIESSGIHTHLFNENIALKDIFKFYIFTIKQVNLFIENNIIHKDLHLDNIIINPTTKKKYIIDFGLSICTKYFYTSKNQLNYKYLNHIFLVFDPEWSYWPIENHILCYFLFKKTKLTEESLTDILDKYFNHNYVFKQSVDVMKYKQNVFQFYKEKYINDEDIEIYIKEILSDAWKTWDMYQHSYILLIFIYKENVNNINSFKNMLFRSLHYDYLKRPSIHDLLSNYYHMLKSYKKTINHIYPITKSNELTKLMTLSKRD